MKNLITIILISTLFSFQNNKKILIDNEYFLIGTLSDYMGREKYQDVEEWVDKYHQSEKKLCLAIDSMFRINYPDLKFSSYVTKISKEDMFELHSKKLVKKIETFYTFKPSRRGTTKGIMDFDSKKIDSLVREDNFIEKYYDTIYVGNLKMKVFKSEKKKLSFITGAYVRYGSKVDSSLYQIRVFNSSSKVKILDELLKDIGCTHVDYNIKYSIPVGHTVSFIPTNKLIDYIEKYEKLKK